MKTPPQIEEATEQYEEINWRLYSGRRLYPTELFEVLYQKALNQTDLQILAFIARKTFGYGKASDEISLSQFVLETGLTRQTVVSSIARLKLVQVVRLVKKGTSKKQSNVYKLDLTGYKNKLVKYLGLVKYDTKQLVKVIRLTDNIYTDNNIKNPKERKQEISSSLGNTSTKIPWTPESHLSPEELFKMVKDPRFVTSYTDKKYGK